MDLKVWEQAIMEKVSENRSPPCLVSKDLHLKNLQPAFKELS